MRLAIYSRVSTLEQNVAAQDHATEQWLARHPQYDTVQRFVDEGLSGKTSHRPQYQAMCAAVAAGQFDAVCVYRLDRLSRNAVDALRLLLDWLQGGIEFYAVDQPVLQLGRDNPLRLTVAAMLSEFAQLEREAIVSRVRSGLAAAQARGVRLGAQAKLSAAQVAQAVSMHESGMTTRQVGEQLGVSCATVSRVLRRSRE